MAKNTGLLAALRAGLGDDRASSTSLLHQCILLGGEVGSEALRDWARQELKGYPNVDTMPDYRWVTAPLRIDGVTVHGMITGQAISPMSLPDFARDAITEPSTAKFAIGGLPLVNGKILRAAHIHSGRSIMTATEHTLSELLRHAARRVRNDGRFELQTALDNAPFRAVDVGLIADLLAATVDNLSLYEGRGWDEAKILDRVSEVDRAAIALARTIVDPEGVRRHHG